MTIAMHLLEVMREIQALAAQRDGSTPPNVLLARIENIAKRAVDGHAGRGWDQESRK